MIALEWKEFVRERGTGWILGTLLLASAIALAQGVSHYRRQAAAIQATHEQATSALERSRAKAEKPGDHETGGGVPGASAKQM